MYCFTRATLHPTTTNKRFDFRISYKSVQCFVKQFWEAWIRHMPPHSLFQNKWFRPRQDLKTGDHLITFEPGIKCRAAPRGLWEHTLVIKILGLLQ